MATWADLKELRLRINDPSGVVALETVATAAALPATGALQTAYRKEDSGEYVIYDADLSTSDTPVWAHADLELADDRLDNFIDLYGIDRAAPRAIRLILAAIGKRMGLARAGHGAESMQYQTLSDTYAFYKALAESMDEEAAKDEGTSTGRYIFTRRPLVGGGM